MNFPETLLNPRIRLVRANVGDAERILAALEPSSTQNLSFFSKKIDLEKQRKYLASQCASDDNWLWVVERISDGMILGTAGLHEIDRVNHNARLGFLIFRKEHRGQGYGTETIVQVLRQAFMVFRLNKVYLKVFTSNPMADHYRKMGFVDEGVLLQEYCLKGEYHDMFRLAFLKADWRAKILA
ncbi:MAG: GNAT family protein [Patescibacteria group bacterium]|jgi:RimJ/RimL family protein N-acetyltransferase